MVFQDNKQYPVIKNGYYYSPPQQIGTTSVRPQINFQLNRQPSKELLYVWKRIRQELKPFTEKMSQYNLPPDLARVIFIQALHYTVTNANSVSGTNKEKVDKLFIQFQKDDPQLFSLIIPYRIPEKVLKDSLNKILSLSLLNLIQSEDKSWSDWESIAGRLTSGPSSISLTSEDFYVFARGKNRNLYTVYWNGSEWSEWKNLGGKLSSSPAVICLSSSRIDVFARGESNQLIYRSSTNGKWCEWKDLGGTLTSSPAVTACDGRIDVFARDQNKHLQHINWDGKEWSQWKKVNRQQITSAPAAIYSNGSRIDVFARGIRRELMHIHCDGQKWSEWESLDYEISSSPAVISRTENEMDVFAKSLNGEILYAKLSGDKWEQGESVVGDVTSEPTVSSLDGERIDIFARGKDNQLLHIWKS